MSNEKIKHVRRFRENNGKVAPVLVRMKEGVDRVKVVSASKALRKIPGHEKIYVNLDLTQAEREFDKKLRQQRDALNREEDKKGRHFFFCIRNDRIVKFERKSSDNK